MAITPWNSQIYFSKLSLNSSDDQPGCFHLLLPDTSHPHLVCVSVPGTCSLHSKMELQAQVYVWLYFNNFITLRVKCFGGFCLCRALPHMVTVLLTLQSHEMGEPGSISLCCQKDQPSNKAFCLGWPNKDEQPAWISLSWLRGAASWHDWVVVSR